MRIKKLQDEDFVNFKKASMFIGTTTCDWKCCTEAGIPISVCQNSELCTAKTIVYPNDALCQRYLDNSITSAIVIGGLEPFDQFMDIYDFIRTLREKYKCNDPICIYTGYNKQEIDQYVILLKQMPNIYIKFGRYVPNSKSRYDEVLGVRLASENQYGMKVS